jgi:primosomal protein N'
MRIVTVIPISRGISKDTLTYFTKQEPSIGSIVSIPLRKKTVYGLVTESREVKEIKSELKSLPYSIKKIEKIETRKFLSDSFIESTKKIADYNAGSIGAVLSAMIPKNIMENSAELSTSAEKENLGFYETLLLQEDDEERYATYRSLIREEFAKNKSVFFCLPTTEDILSIRPILEKGIEKYTYTLHGGLSKKEALTAWQKIEKDDHPVLILGTGSFLCIPRSDLGVIIIDKESSRAYKMQTRPFIDFRTAAEIIAKELKVKLILGDMLLRVETLWEEKSGKYTALSSLKWRSLGTASCQIINMKGPQDMKKKEFSILGEEIKTLLKNAIENNEHTFLFCGRKGLYPMTICSDCGTVVTCNNCNAPVVLYGKKNVDGKIKNLFVCHHCGERREADELCKNCGGWRLNTFGIGIERVVEEIRSIFPKAKVLVMDKDNVKTHKQAVKLRDLFYSSPGSILLGTEMALTYLNQKIDNAGVVTLDSYFSIPDFQINEKIFHILLELRALAQKNFLIQTRQDNKKIFDYAVKGNLLDFYRDEIADRKNIGYPPFTTYIKITVEGEKNSVKKEMEEVKKFMEPYELSVFDAWNPGGKTKYSMHGLISQTKGKWVDKDLLSKIRNLPPSITVKIDPITLL